MEELDLELEKFKESLTLLVDKFAATILSERFDAMQEEEAESLCKTYLKLQECESILLDIKID